MKSDWDRVSALEGARRRTDRWRIEKAERPGLVRPDVTPRELREAEVTEFNSAYLAAILRTVAKQAQSGT